MSNILRITVLLIISLTLVSGCSEMVGTKSEKTDSESFVKMLQREYESSGISEILQKDYTVNWKVLNLHSLKSWVAPIMSFLLVKIG